MAERTSSSRMSALTSRPNGSSSTTTSATRRPSGSPLRQRPLARASTLADFSNPAAAAASSLRRSSFLTNNSSSHSLDRASLFSSTDDLLLPRASRSGTQKQNHHEPSHLESAPLALALLPAVGGMVWSGGSQVLTDVTLLVLASVFLNWSVRLPWEWYHAAQAVKVVEDDDEDDEDGQEVDDRNATAIIEEEPLPMHTEGSAEKAAGDDDIPMSPTSPTSLPLPSPKQPNTSTGTTPKPPSPRTRSASSELRIHELLALSLCFLSPLLGAALLHTIRSQLSRPSEGLVSDYNLSIFLLAAELRPLSHLIKMVQARTLHLQKVVGRAEHESSVVGGAGGTVRQSELRDLLTRVEELEAGVADRLIAGGGGGSTATTPGAPTAAGPAVDEAALTALARRAVQPDLDALTRATRRYEKKATLLGLQTSAKLHELEARLQDALTLAAGAERAASRRGVLATAADGVLWLVGMPGRVVGAGVRWGLGVGWEAWGLVGGVVGWRGKGERERARTERERELKGKGKGKERERRKKEY